MCYSILDPSHSPTDHYSCTKMHFIRQKQISIDDLMGMQWKMLCNHEICIRYKCNGLGRQNDCLCRAFASSVIAETEKRNRKKKMNLIVALVLCFVGSVFAVSALNRNRFFFRKMHIVGFIRRHSIYQNIWKLQLEYCIRRVRRRRTSPKVMHAFLKFYV